MCWYTRERGFFQVLSDNYFSEICFLLKWLTSVHFLCLFILWLQKLFIFFNLLHCFHTFFVVGLCLETFHKFRSLKYADVYVIVPFQSASELSFPSRVFSGVTHIRYSSLEIWTLQGTPTDTRRLVLTRCMEVCAEGQVETCASLDRMHTSKCSQYKSLSRYMSMYLSLFTTFFLIKEKNTSK